jgi:precorrin-4/cobalt-precorrin-4 C11-methyltransferase
MTLEETIAVMCACRTQDMDVVRLHTGEPALYGAIGEQMAELDKRGIAYEVVPGISSFQAAAAALKCELTMPEVAQTVVLTRTAGRTPVPAAEALARIACLQATVCVFLSVDKTAEVAEALRPVYGADCPAAVVYHASWPDQQVVRGTLADIADRVRTAGMTRTGMILVGRALGTQTTVSRLYDARFAHGYREATKPT